MNQVDDRCRRHTVGIILGSLQRYAISCFSLIHAKTAEVACTEDLHILEARHFLWCIDEYVTAVLHDITVGIS